MKAKLLVLVAIVCCAFTTADKDLSKQIIGKWCNPYTYQSSGEIKGFNFKKGGKCEAINVPSLDLKNWKIENGKLIITGFSIEADGSRSEYRSEERISELSCDSLLVVSQEENPRLEFLYVRPEVVMEKKKPSKTK